MCICARVCVYMYIYVYIHTYKSTYMYIYVCVRIHERFNLLFNPGVRNIRCLRESLREAYGTLTGRNVSARGASLEHLGDLLATSWILLGPLGCLLNHLGCLLGASWGLLGTSRVLLGTTWLPCALGDRPPRKRARGLREAYGKLTGSLREFTWGSGEGAEFAS